MKSSKAKGKSSNRKKQAGKAGRRPISRTLIRLVYLLLLLMIVATAYLGYQLSQGTYGRIPGRDDLEEIRQAQATEVYTRYGTLMGRYYFENRNNIRFGQIPPHLIQALVATEDARFYEHHGIDTRSLLRVFFKTILMGDESSGGGSTISQQLAKNLFPRQGDGHIALIGSKIREMIIAWRLEGIYPKEQIIQMYLNTVPFGENTYGIKNASQLYFNKLPGQLTAQQGATLVGMLKGTSLYNPHRQPENARRRRNIVLSLMAQEGYLQPQQARQMMEKPLATDYSPIDHNNGLAPYLREHLRPRLEEWCSNHTRPDGKHYNLYTDGLRVYTTIDADLQRYANKAVQKHLPWLQEQLNREQENGGGTGRSELLRKIISRIPAYSASALDNPRAPVNREKKMEVFTWDGPRQVTMSPADSIRHCISLLQTGFVAMDPHNGNMLAWVGGIDHRFFKYDHVTSKRQVGSTFKPIVYASALQSGIGPCEYYPNDSIVYEQYDNWSPANADNKYGGHYSVEGALVNSVNTVSVQLLMESSIDSAIHLAAQMGLDGRFPRVPSLALGTVNASVLDMAEAYSAFASGGVPREARLLYKIENSEGEVLETFNAAPGQDHVLKTKTCELITMMLQGVVDRGTASSLKKNFRFGGDLAGKTGTTQKQADGWFVGYNPNLVVASWVGADYPAVHFNSLPYGQGASSALPIAGHFLHQLQQEHPGTSYLTRFKYSQVDTSHYRCSDYREKAPGFIDRIFKALEPKKDNKREKDNEGFFKKLLDKLKKLKEKDNQK